MALTRFRKDIRRLLLPGFLAIVIGPAALTDNNFLTASAQVTDQSPRQPVINRGAKDTSVKQLLDEKVSVIYPSYLPKGFQQTAIKKAWVDKIEWSPPPGRRRVPARKVVFIAFTKAKGTKADIFLFQTPYLKGVQTLDNIYPALGEGYFIAEIKRHDIIQYRRLGEVDYLMVFRGVTEEEIPRILNSMKPIEEAEANK